MGNLFTNLQQEREKQRQALDQPVVQETSQPTSKQVSQETSQPAAQVVSLPTLPIPSTAYRKQTFEIPVTAYDLLEDVKIACRRQYGVSVTKNEIVLIALELMAQDFQENKQTSFLVRKFAGKPAR